MLAVKVGKLGKNKSGKHPKWMLAARILFIQKIYFMLIKPVNSRTSHIVCRARLRMSALDS